MATCSVILVSYHTGPVLFVSVKSALRQKQLAEVILVDNGNPPATFARLLQMSLTEPRLKIITGHGNIGFAKACNLGAKEATGDFLLLLDSDCLLPPDALERTMAAFTDVPGAMLAGCRILEPDGSDYHDSRGCLLTPQIFVSQTLGLDRLQKLRRMREPKPVPPTTTHEVAAISSAFMCLRRSDFGRLQGLDENFFLQVNAFDLCLRVRAACGKVIRVPQVMVTHMPGHAVYGALRFVEWQKTQGIVQYFKKHFRKQRIPGFLILVEMLLEIRCAVKVIIGGIKNLARTEPVMEQSVAAKRLMILASGVAELPETKTLQDTTVLVTGATSQVGLCVLRRLLAAGASVLALSRGEAIPFQYERLRWIKGDLTDKALRLDDYLADVMVHCAPLWHLPPTIDLLAESQVKRVIAFGSTSVFAKALSKNDFEKDMVANLRRAETEIAEHCTAKKMDWTILRPTLTYGVGLDVNVTSLAKLIRRFGLFPVYPPAFGRRQPVHADDLALAVLQALANPETYSKSYNISGGEIITYREMLERLFKLCHKKLWIIPTTLLPFILDVAGIILRKKHINGEIARRMNDDLVFFHDEAKRDFGFSPRTFLSGGIRDIEGF